MTKVTIEDISRQTGLSRGTVSRALNDRPDISEQTKQRVLEACRTLNYVPSYAARSLATGRTFAVTVLIPEIKSSFVNAFLEGVLNRAASAQYLVSIIELDHDPSVARERLRMLSGERIDGLVVASELDGEVAQRIVETLGNRPIASTYPIPDVPCDVLGPDLPEAGRLMAQHLYDVTGPAMAILYDREIIGAEQIVSGFRERAVQLGAAAECAHRVTPSTNLTDVLRNQLASVRGVAATDESLAAGLLLAAASAGRAAGRELALVSFGGGASVRWLQPSLSYVDSVGEEIGSRAMETLLQRLAKARHDAPENTAVAPRLVPRDSSRLG